jgi:hypothetical protein
MSSVSDSWLGVGVVLMMSVIVVGLSTFLGKLIIWLFGTESEGREATDLRKLRRDSACHDAA